MANIGQGRKAGDRRRVRANRIVDTAHVGRAAGNTLGRAAGTMTGKVSRTAEFNTGTSSSKNGRA